METGKSEGTGKSEPSPIKGGEPMPLWLQIAGALASALLSYLTAYDDHKVRERLDDISHDIKDALGKLNDISTEINRVLVQVQTLPEKVRQLLVHERLAELNTAVGGALIHYGQLISGKEKGNEKFVLGEVKLIYDEVVKARTKLQYESAAAEVMFAPMAAIISPIALLLELSLLHRLGAPAKNLSIQTAKSYLGWFDSMLSAGRHNSVAAYLLEKSSALTTINAAIHNGMFGSALANVGRREAVYGLEHQIGSTVLSFSLEQGLLPYDTRNTTWIRLYGTVTMQKEVVAGESIWSLQPEKLNFQVEQYARRGPSDAWFGPKPPYSLAVQYYDSRDVQRFEGQTHAARVADIYNSGPWRDFTVNRFPQAVEQLATYDQLRINVRFATDVIAAVREARKIALAIAGEPKSALEYFAATE
jgi:hypothetical protein